jgi:hypothetical protein
MITAKPAEKPLILLMGPIQSSAADRGIAILIT